MRIMVVTGSSGGHIFPAFSFLDTLKARYKKDVDTLLILPRTSLERGIRTDGYNVHYVSGVSIKLNLDFINFIALLKLFKACLESLILCLEFRPDIVVGFGSLVSVPVLFFAWVFRIKTLIHEQNVSPGQANRLLAKFTDKIAVSFSSTQAYLRVPSEKIVLTGNPIRKDLKRIDKNKALDFFGLSHTKFTILIMGGSSGSHSINMGCLKAVSLISDRAKIQLIHLTGVKDYHLVESGYQNLNIENKIFSFLKDISYAYNAADLVISRAGATSIAEIIFFGLPAILVPYPFVYKHQLSNAKFLESRATAIIIEDDKLDSAILKDTLQDLINEPAQLEKMRHNYNNIPKIEADDLLVKEVMALN